MKSQAGPPANAELDECGRGMLEDASTKKNRRDFAGGVLRDGDDFERGEEVRGENWRHHRPIGASRVHHSHHTFVVFITSVMV